MHEHAGVRIKSEVKLIATCPGMGRVLLYRRTMHLRCQLWQQEARSFALVVTFSAQLHCEAIEVLSLELSLPLGYNSHQLFCLLLRKACVDKARVGLRD